MSQAPQETLVTDYSVVSLVTLVATRYRHLQNPGTYAALGPQVGRGSVSRAQNDKHQVRPPGGTVFQRILRLTGELANSRSLGLVGSANPEMNSVSSKWPTALPLET